MVNRVVPFVDLARQFVSQEDELVESLRRIGRSGVYVLGQELEKFEYEMCEFLGVRHSVGVANGSDALVVALKALGIGRGHEVITVSNSFIATAWVIDAVGATPVFVDVDDDLNINPDLIEEAVTERTRAVLPVHLAGHPVKMDEVLAIAAKYNLRVIEDAAQAIGASFKRKAIGAWGDVGCFSLHPLKNLGVFGDGGLISTNNSDVAAYAKLIRNHGLETRDSCVMWGINSRLDPLQAAFASTKLRNLRQWNERNRLIANRYSTALSSVVNVPVTHPDSVPVFHNYIIKTHLRDDLASFLEKNGVGSRIHYPVPIHLQKVAKGLRYLPGSLRNTERLASEILSLPIYPELTDEEVDYVIEKILSFFHQRREL